MSYIKPLKVICLLQSFHGGMALHKLKYSFPDTPVDFSQSSAGLITW